MSVSVVPPRPGRGPGSYSAGGCWPTDDQVLLLRAALLDTADARPAWERWRIRNTLDTADSASARLLPLIYRNLRSAGLDEADLAKLKGAYRAAWVRNQLLFKRAAEALGALRDAGVQTMLLKGIALSVAHYRDDGVRPMEDIDVLVPWHDFERAFEVLTRAGWTSDRESRSAGGLTAGHAQELQHRDGHALDLHRYALVQAAVDEPFWSASVEIELLGVPTRALCAADQLLHVAVHGAHWGAVPPVRWLADAVAVERSAGAGLDWDRLVAEASRRRVTVALAAALERLGGTVGFPLPGWVLERLRDAPKGRLERWAHRAALQPPGGGNWLPVHLDHYVRRSRVERSLRLTEFLQEHYGVRTRRQLAGRLARKTADAALTQGAMRIAPERVVACAACGRTVVRLRPAREVLCEPCTSARGHQ
jgi:hypothetical protein